VTDSFFQTNRARWNELVAIHERSAFYDVDGFRAGKCSLRPLEVDELGDVAGKSLLHLQCHFGLDSLSWARRGARVTGVDFSERAIERARALAAETGLDADFVCANVYDLPAVLPGSFDVVFTSYGVLAHLPDLPRWGQVIAHFLKPGGVFYLAEIHPFALALDDRKACSDLRIGYDYFHTAEPIRWEAPGTYADRDAIVHNSVAYEWAHSLGDVINAVAGTGLRIDFLHEFPFCCFALLPRMERGGDGWYYLPEGMPSVPLLFSLRAHASATV
jgi:2-polyprenyl-3-methyl-5-hydroxy-6-metoxy-1,4-benzoquinol methylase